MGLTSAARPVQPKIKTLDWRSLHEKRVVCKSAYKSTNYTYMRHHLKRNQPTFAEFPDPKLAADDHRPQLHLL